MKKHVKTVMYSKMYLITPMVYDKIEKYLDKSDKMTLTNINKPFFSPKIDFYGGRNEPFQQHFPPQPPPSPLQQFRDVKPEIEPKDDPIEEQQGEVEREMEWEHETHEPRVTHAIETQTDQPLTQDVEIQTEPVLRKITPTTSSSTQTDFEPKAKPKKVFKRKKVLKTREVLPSMPILEEMESAETDTGERGTFGSVLPQLSIQHFPRQVSAPQIHEILPSQSRSLLKIPDKTVSILRRTPIKITLPKEMRNITRDIHRSHYGLPLTGQPVQSMIHMTPRMLPITYESENITSQEHPIAVPQTSTVAVPESRYFVETPSNVPPGQTTFKRTYESDTEIVPEHKIIKKQYKRKQVRPQQDMAIEDIEMPGTQGIDLPFPERRPKYPCDTCGAFLSSKYNLKRHKEREALRRSKMEDVIPFEEQPEYLEWLRAQEEQQQPSTSTASTSTDSPEFSSWVKLPAKRTSTEARLPRTRTKKVTTEQAPQSETFSQWENPTSQPKGKSKRNLSKGKRALSPPPPE